MNGWIWFGIALAGFGVAVLLAVFMGRVLRGPSTQEREAVQDAPDTEWDDDPAPDLCKHGVYADDECPAVRRAPAVGRAVVAGSDLDPLEALYRAPAFTGVRSVRMPGEGR